ncbi:MAG: UbiD family decarboxylase [Anaerolineales bacterium]
MSLRDHIQKLANNDELITVQKAISKKYEISGVLKKLEPQTVLFERVTESPFQVIGNLFCNKEQFADYFGINVKDIIPKLTAAITSPVKPDSSQIVQAGNAACQQVIHLEPDLNQLPIPLHFDGDGGCYITAGVVFAKHPAYGQNMDFHRCMQFSSNQMAVRVVKGRHFHHFLEELGKVDVAICIGNSPEILAAAATSVDLGVDEISIATALANICGMTPPQLTQAKTVDLLIPAQTEFVIEGTVYRDQTHVEGPFVDLTETQDICRQEPVLGISAITHREDAIWQALLPGSLEHKLLMGMPREPTIYQAVNRVVKCLDVNINPGGCSWLHAVVQIDKQNKEDGKLAIAAAFAGHRSCKHVFIVDRDIDIYDPLQVEWAMATRFQGDRDMIILDKEPGSSLDPSAEPGTKLTTKIGFDLTAPVGEARKHFEKVPYPAIDLNRFL